jgi:hypothetical protein
MKTFIACICFLTPILLQSKSSSCSIDYLDLKSNIKKTLQYNLKDSAAGTRKIFMLNKTYKCYFTYFDSYGGTSISCAYIPDMEQTYFQSDRSSIRENKPKNNLVFKHMNNSFQIKTMCK